MILHDFRCNTCGFVSEHFIKSDVNSVRCTRCEGYALKVILQTAKPHWSSLAMGDNASPEAIEKFDKMHRQQKAKEQKSYDNHGDYGPAPGSSGGNGYRGDQD